MKTRDIESMIPESMLSIAHEAATCPSVKGWPDNAFAEWVASHRDQVRGLVCSEPKYTDAPFCNRSF
jgi:hypothetical protein